MTPEDNLKNPRAVAPLIDHTLLKPEATRDDVSRLCNEARDFHFASVCINPYWVRLAADALASSNVNVCTVIGFPLGANDTRTKIAEAEFAMHAGARELDMVLNIGALRSKEFHVVQKDIADVADAAHSRGAALKVILETCLLTDEEKVTACRLAVHAQADFVKTSTGFSTGGATVADIELMRRTVGNVTGIKASGGVRTLATLQQMVAAGATRIGTSSGVNILRELDASLHPASAVASEGSPVGSY